MDNFVLFTLYSVFLPLFITILFIIYGLYKCNHINEKKPSIFDTMFEIEILTCGVAVFLFLFFIIGITLRYNAFTFEHKEPRVEESVTEIASINLNTSSNQALHGSFILGSGSISSESKVENYFYFYAKDENGRFKLDKLNAEEVLLEENGEVNPCVLISKTFNVVETIPTKFGKFLGFKNETSETLDESLTETIIRIPSGSVVQEYNPNFK